jgi:putative tryptophan/tyrosine transport system substrate-binding protein
MRRREFIGLLGGAAAWPFGVWAQQTNRMRRIGVLMSIAADDMESQPRITAFKQGLQQLGWTEGRDVHIEVRWWAGNDRDRQKYVAELIALAPDIIVVSGSTYLELLLKSSNAIPIVFVPVPDPVGSGYVESMSRPGGNATGFVMFEYGLAAKWLELLKQIAPDVKRAAILRDASISLGIGQFAVIQSVAPSLGVDVVPINLRDTTEIEHAVAAFARSAKGGLISTSSAFAAVHRDLIITLAARHKLPAVYIARLYVASGGLISYGPNFINQHRQAASYVDRILKGEKPADLPVQAPTKYELAVNLNTAKALGIDIPQTILTRADEVIE